MGMASMEDLSAIVVLCYRTKETYDHTPTVSPHNDAGAGPLG